MENSMAVPQEIRNRFTIRRSNSTPGYMPKRTESRNSNRYLYINVYRIIIYNNKRIETNQMSIDEWLDKQTMTYTYNRI